MATCFDATFTLVLQRDRRQRPDRRQGWRGGRRETDHMPFAEQLLEGDQDDWAEVIDVQNLAVEKTEKRYM
jgi:hypothetical protein